LSLLTTMMMTMAVMVVACLQVLYPLFKKVQG
jgi:hypothetical protein